MSSEPTRFMIDIETLGTKPGCAVTAVGILRFDPFSAEPIKGAEFGVRDGGGHQDPATLEWWAHPDRAEAKDYLRSLSHVQAEDVMGALVNYVHMQPPSESVEWWAKSPSFDMAILEDLADRTGTFVPWKFREPRDVRTAFSMVGPDFVWADLVPNAPLHSPLADCQLQADQVSQVLRNTRGTI